MISTSLCKSVYFLSSIISKSTTGDSLIVCGGSEFGPFLLFSTLFPSSFTIILMGKRAGCFT